MVWCTRSPQWPTLPRPAALRRWAAASAQFRTWPTQVDPRAGDPATVRADCAHGTIHSARRGSPSPQWISTHRGASEKLAISESVGRSDTFARARPGRWDRSDAWPPAAAYNLG